MQWMMYLCFLLLARHDKHFCCRVNYLELAQDGSCIIRNKQAVQVLE